MTSSMVDSKSMVENRLEQFSRNTLKVSLFSAFKNVNNCILHVLSCSVFTENYQRVRKSTIWFSWDAVLLEQFSRHSVIKIFSFFVLDIAYRITHVVSCCFSRFRVTWLRYRAARKSSYRLWRTFCWIWSNIGHVIYHFEARDLLMSKMLKYFWFVNLDKISPNSTIVMVEMDNFDGKLQKWSCDMLFRPRTFSYHKSKVYVENKYSIRLLVTKIKIF